MFGNKAQMQNMMKKARKMQEDMEKAKEKIKSMTVDVTVGGGAVSLTMTGEHQIQTLTVSPDALDPSDPEMLVDLITTAVNEASRKADEMVAAEMQKITSGLSLPGGLF